MNNPKLTCADLNAKGEIRCPTINSNTPGLVFYQFKTFDNRHREWIRWARTLPEPERTAKLRAIEASVLLNYAVKHAIRSHITVAR